MLPSHGEGWGRPHVEAMAMGRPVIATNWSGTTAFLDEQVGYPIAVEKIAAAVSPQLLRYAVLWCAVGIPAWCCSEVWRAGNGLE